MREAKRAVAPADKNLLRGVIAYAKQMLGASVRDLHDEQRQTALRAVLDTLHEMRQGPREKYDDEPDQWFHERSERFYVSKGRFLRYAMQFVTAADLANVDSGFVQ